MRHRLVFPLVLLVTSTFAGCATETVTPDGLVSTQSGRVDALYIRPNTDIRAYRRVVIEPVAVKFRSDFLTQQHGLNYLLAQHLDRPNQEPEAIAHDFSALMQDSLISEFRKANYEIVSTGGPGVLRIVAKIDELFVNAPDRMSSTTLASFNRETGQANLSLEAVDAVSGSVLARIVHHNIVRQPTRLSLANDTTNRFWFETAFQRWAANVTAELGVSRRAQLSQVR